MAIVIVGGHSRNVGKTSVVAGLIAALPEFRWTAMKITQYGHGICSRNGEACDCATADHTFAITEERDRKGESDTSRFLVAGASPVWWVRSQQGRLAEAMPSIRGKMAAAQNMIIESNSLVQFVRPDLYLTVLDPATEDFKKSAQQMLDRVDGVIMHESSAEPVWNSVSLKPVAERPVFRVRPPEYVTDEIVQFVRTKVAGVSPITELAD